jgi:hypothetical protein
MLRRVARAPRKAVVATVAALGAAACCPDAIRAGEPCSFVDQCPGQGKPGCGLNGFRCEDGKWRELMTYCNPPMPTAAPSAAPSATSSATSAAAPSATSGAKETEMDDATLAAAVGQPLAEVVTRLGLREGSLSYEDEPPGKLRAVRAAVGPDEEIVIHLRYDSALLFSQDRSWPLARIGPAVVVGVAWRRGPDRRVHGEVPSP